ATDPAQKPLQRAKIAVFCLPPAIHLTKRTQTASDLRGWRKTAATVTVPIEDSMKTAIKTLIVSLSLLLPASLITGCASDRAVIDQAEQFNTTLDKAVIHDP